MTDSDFSPDDRIVHDQYGPGRVRAVDSIDAATGILVEFDSYRVDHIVDERDCEPADDEP